MTPRINRAKVSYTNLVSELTAREISGVHSLQNRYRLAFKQLYPGQYYFVEEDVVDGNYSWQDAVHKPDLYCDIDIETVRLHPQDIELVHAILVCDVMKCQHILSTLIFADSIFSNNDLFWSHINPFSPLQPHHSSRIKDIFWAYIKKHCDSNLIEIAKWSIRTHQSFQATKSSIQQALANNQQDIADAYVRLFNAACSVNRTDIVTFMIEIARNNAINLPFLDGLYQAVNRGYEELTRILLMNGHPSNINTRNELNEDLLHTACRRGLTGIAKLLLEYGADINSPAQEEPGGPIKRPIHYACMCRNSEIALLLINYSRQSGMMMLEQAWHDQDTEIMDFLITNDVNISQPLNLIRHRDTTLLHLACKTSKIEMIELLFKSKFANFFRIDQDGDTPFDLLIRQANRYSWHMPISILTRIINKLAIDNGIISDELASMLRDIVQERQYKAISRACERACKPDLQLLYAILTGQSLNEIQRLIDNGATPEGIDQFAWKPLDLAHVISPNNHDLLGLLRNAIDNKRLEQDNPSQLKRARF